MPRGYPPSLAALLTGFDDASRVHGLQFTRLTPDGRDRTARLFLRGSRPMGAVVRLVNDAEVTTEHGVCEGIESGVAAMQTMRSSGQTVLPIWAALSAGNLAKLPVIPAIERLSIFHDAGGVGVDAARELAERWYRAGRDVFLFAPPFGDDWNTVEVAHG